MSSVTWTVSPFQDQFRSTSDCFRIFFTGCPSTAILFLLSTSSFCVFQSQIPAFNLDNFNNRNSEHQSLVQQVRLWSYCSGRFVQITRAGSKGVDANGEKEGNFSKYTPIRNSDPPPPFNRTTSLWVTENPFVVADVSCLKCFEGFICKMCPSIDIVSLGLDVRCKNDIILYRYRRALDSLGGLNLKTCLLPTNTPCYCPV